MPNKPPYIDRKRMLLKSERLFSKAAEAKRKGDKLLRQAVEYRAESDRVFIEQARLEYYQTDRPSDELLWEVAVAKLDVTRLKSKLQAEMDYLRYEDKLYDMWGG